MVRCTKISEVRWSGPTYAQIGRAKTKRRSLLKGVRRGQRSGQRARQTQLQDGERRFEPFAQGPGRIFAAPTLEPAYVVRQMRQDALFPILLDT